MLANSRVLHYRILNVFTDGDNRFSGNPLCFFEDATGLSEQDMQDFARQLNLSETTFITLGGANVSANIRIFTPNYEVAHFTAITWSAGSAACSSASREAARTAAHHSCGSCSAPPPSNSRVAIARNPEALTSPRLETSAALTVPEPMSMARTWGSAVAATVQVTQAVRAGTSRRARPRASR